MVGACRSVHALSIPDWASLVCLPEPEVPRYVSARGKFPESLILGRLVEQPCLVCLPVSGSLYFLCRVNGGSWDRPVSVDAILSCCALHDRRVLRLCDSENVRQPVFSNCCRCCCEWVLVPASSLAAEPRTDPVSRIDLSTPKDVRGSNSLATFDRDIDWFDTSVRL